MQLNSTAIERAHSNGTISIPVTAYSGICIGTILIFHLSGIRTDINQRTAITVGLAVNISITFRTDCQIIYMATGLAPCCYGLSR